MVSNHTHPPLCVVQRCLFSGVIDEGAIVFGHSEVVEVAVAFLLLVGCAGFPPIHHNATLVGVPTATFPTG